MELIPAELPKHLFIACCCKRRTGLHQKDTMNMLTLWSRLDIQSGGSVDAESQDQTWSWQWTNQTPIFLTAVRSRTPGWSGISLTHSLLVCLSFPPLLFIAPSLFNTLTLLSLNYLFSCLQSLLFSHSFVKHAYPTSKPHYNNPDKGYKPFSAVLLHFLPLLHFLSFASLFVSKPVILSLSMPLRDTYGPLWKFQN